MRWIVLLILAVSLLACGGRQREAVGGEGILLGDAESLMGEAEERARGFLLDMAFVLEANMDEPDRALDRLRALFAVNDAPMRSNIAELQAHLGALEGEQRRLYEAQFAAHMAAAATEWRQRQAAFTSRWPDQGRQVALLVAGFDQ